MPTCSFVACLPQCNSDSILSQPLFLSVFLVRPVLRTHQLVPSLLLCVVVGHSLGDVPASSGHAACNNKAARFVSMDKHTTFLCFSTPD